MTPAEELDLRMAEPTKNGEVVRFAAAYPNSPKTYDYLAIKAGGLWYISGKLGAVGVGTEWDDLISTFRDEGVTITSVRRAASWESL